MKILLSGKNNMENYAAAITAMGAEAYGGYLTEGNACDYDGLILCGGGDIDPSYYGEENNGSANIDLDRDKHEFALAKDFIKAEKPILGICRGCQLLNICFGGSLIQHLDTANVHKGDTDLVHEVFATKESFLKQSYGESFVVNSSHHQAACRMGDGLRVLLKSKEGVIEAFEHESLPIIGVQFHPERMCLGKKRDDTVDGIKIFEYFIEKCSEAMK